MRRIEPNHARGTTRRHSPEERALREGFLELSDELQLALDAQGLLRAVSPALARRLGSSPEALEGQPLAGVLPAAAVEAVREGLERARRSGGLETWSSAWADAARPDALQWRARLQPAADLVLAVARESAAPPDGLQTLRERERLLTDAFNALPHSIFVVDSDSNYLLVNRVWAERYGHAPEHLVGRNVMEVEERPLEDRRRILALVQEVLRGDQETHQQEVMRTDAEGARHVFRTWRSRLRNDAGQVTGVVGISMDVTAERETEQHFRDLIEGSIQGIVVLRNRKPLFVNAAYARMHGYDNPDDILALESINQLLTPEEAIRLSGYAAARLRGEPAPQQFEYQGVRKDGSLAWFDGVVKMVEWEGAPAIQATIMDITERRAAEQKLRDNQLLLQTVLDTVPHVIFVKDRESNYVLANTAWYRYHGGGPGGLAGQHTMQLDDRPRADRESALALDEQVFREGRQLEVEYKRTQSDGTEVIFHNYRVPLRDDSGEIVGLVGISDDVTAIRRAEQELRESQRLLSLVMDTVPQNLFVKGLDGRYLLANRAMGKLHDLDPRDIVGRHASELPGLRPAEIAFLRETDRQVIERGTLMEWPEVPLTSARGERRVHRVAKLPLLDAQGNVEAIACVSEDITERLRSELDLRSSQRLLRLVIDALPHNVYVKSLDGRYLLANQAMAEFHGLTPEAMTGQRLTALPGPTPDERDVLGSTDAEVIAKGEMISWPEVSITNIRGEQTIRRLHKLPLRDEEGEIQGTIGVSEDITALIRTEQDLQASHRLLRTVLDTIPHRVSVKNAQERFEMVNRAWARHYDVPAERALGRTMEELGLRPYMPDDPVPQADQRILRGELPLITLPITQNRPDGTTGSYLTFRAPVLDADQRPAGIVSATVDVSELRRVEDELRASRQLLQTVFDAMPIWVYVKDRDGYFVVINRIMAEAHRVDPDIVNRERLRALSPEITPEQQAVLNELDARIVATGEPVDYPELELTLPGGRTRRLRSIRLPLKDDAGTVVGIVGVTEDITERERAERAMQQAQKLESLGVLAGGIAHDFNNLLVAVLGYASLVYRQLPAESPLRPLVRNIETAGQRAGELCSQMLAYAGKGLLKTRRIQLNSLTQEMSELIRVSLSPNIQFNQHFAKGLPDVEVDDTQLRQVVMNLLINASEAIGEQGGTITLRTGLGEVRADDPQAFVAETRLPPGRYVLLELQDTGCGMDAATLNRIFDPFFTTKFSGRGLGLAAVLGIVRRHQGALRVTSRPGRGTTFTVLLPPAQDASAAPVAAPEPELAAGSGVVLVVDDEPVIRNLARMMLEERGFEVAEAGRGEAAVDEVVRLGESLRLVLLDVTMPGMSSEEALRRMVQRGLHAPVVVMSGLAESEVRERFQGLPVTAYAAKPFTMSQLLGRVSEALADRPA